MSLASSLFLGLGMIVLTIGTVLMIVGFMLR